MDRRKFLRGLSMVGSAFVTAACNGSPVIPVAADPAVPEAGSGPVATTAKPPTLAPTSIPVATPTAAVIFEPSATPVAPATPKPTEVPPADPEPSATPVPEKFEELRVTQDTVAAFAKEMQLVPADVLKGITIKPVGKDGKYLVAITTDGYPLMSQEEGEEWKAVPMRLVADGAGMRVGTLLADKYSKAGPAVQQHIAQNYNAGYVCVDGFITEPTPGNFKFDEGNAALTVAEENNMATIGGHLTYGAADFSSAFAKGKKDAPKAELLQLIENHIKGVMTQYKGRIGVWSVVNESGKISWNSDADPYANCIGEDEYINHAFTVARAINQKAPLIYNQGRNHTQRGYSENSDRFQMTLDIVNRLRGKELIDGVGLQMHVSQNGWSPPSKADLIAAFKAYGLPVYITELDVNMSFYRKEDGSKPTDEEKAAKQAEVYRDIFEAAMESGVCKDINMWGVGDKYSWFEYQRKNPDAVATILHNDLSPKRAYYEVMKAMYSKWKS